MKLVLSIIFFFTIGLSNNQTQQPSVFKISTFKNVPDDLMGCGNDYYLTEKDKKQDELVCRTDYITALIYINNKPILLKANYKLGDKENQVYTNGNYMVNIKIGSLKQLDSEYYEMKATIIVKYGSKIIWSKNLIGDGGC
jgi:hypothetical protein